MTASWGDLFERGAAYDIDRERIHAVSDGLEDDANADAERSEQEGDDG